MLKLYVDRDKPVNRANNLVVPVPRREDLRDGMHSDPNDFGVDNLAILSNLDWKLSHMQPQEN
jgi:hypothetical protein